MQNKDTDLREALKRKYAETPQLPADFMTKMQEKMQPQPATKTRGLWRWTAVAACLLLIIGVGIKMIPTENKTEPATLIVQHHEAAPATVQPSESEKPSCSQQQAELLTAKGQVARSDKPVVTKKEIVEKPEKVEKVAPIAMRDPNIHYAAYTEANDTVTYQAPSRVDDFIAKLADYHQVKGVPLQCTSDKGADSTIVSTAYLFEEKGELDLFARLLQVACCYDTKTPGYLLNFSNKQFVFCLKDLREGQKYLWIAERLNSEYILLFSTHSPIETNVSSTCFQEYREQLTHTGINILQF
jgi:hypothetical protein